MYFDIYYLILVLPAVLLSLWAQTRVTSTYEKYSKYTVHNHITGSEAARRILNENGLSHIRVERVSGKLTDHYDPRNNVIRLSDGVYDSVSVAAVGVAAHEAGHAVQYGENYLPIKTRNTILPVANLGSNLAVPLAILGFIFGYEPLVSFGILLFGAVVLFQVATLPVEFNASSRAVKILSSTGMIFDEEEKGVKKVLSAAALTYVAAALTALMNLIRLILVFGKRDD